MQLGKVCFVNKMFTENYSGGVSRVKKRNVTIPITYILLWLSSEIIMHIMYVIYFSELATVWGMLSCYVINFMFHIHNCRVRWSYLLVMV